MLLFGQNGSDGFLKIPAADAAGTVRFNVAGDQAAHHFRRLVGGFEQAGHQLTVLPGRCAQLVHDNILHGIAGFPGQSLFHRTK